MQDTRILDYGIPLGLSTESSFSVAPAHVVPNIANPKFNASRNVLETEVLRHGGAKTDVVTINHLLRTVGPPTIETPTLSVYS